MGPFERQDGGRVFRPLQDHAAPKPLPGVRGAFLEPRRDLGRGRCRGGRDPFSATHGGGGVGVPDGKRDQGGDDHYRGGGQEGVVECGEQRGPGAAG